ncbi:MAG TPA: carboxylesterase family protein [Rhizomicrobium sp.]|nr:carboxylesterase family protein [Rhizomicrobium sp.]
MLRFHRLICCTALALMAATAALAGVMNPVPGDPVTIDTGRLSGTLLDSGVKAYYGVPFAAPPVRELRWHEPMPARPWKGIYNADTKITNCYIPLRATTLNHYFGEIKSSEDCLYMNIWVPPGAKPGDHLPVVVWVHGGGFQEGSINFDVYSGEPLARKGVIFMGISYRVNIFGNMAHPELTAASPHHSSGNYGLLDQIAGLQWIQRNIATFGGDPKNVTLVGQSAGAMALDLLQSSPLAHGLYAKIIALSGGYHGVAAPHLETLAETEAKGVKLQQAMKASDVAQMRTIPADQITDIARANHIVFSGPTIDGYVVPGDPADVYAAGKQTDVPLLLSSVGNDIFSKTPVTDARTLADYKKAAETLYGADAATFLKLFPASNDAQAAHQAQEVARISGFGIMGRDWAKAASATAKSPIWLVQYDHPHPYPPGVVITDMDVHTAGAYHNSDLPFWYGTLDSLNLFRHTRDWTPYDYKLSNQMQDVIVAFARTGDPSTAEVKIPRYNPGHEQRLVFGDNGTRVETLNEKQIDFIESHPLKRN